MFKGDPLVASRNFCPLQVLPFCIWEEISDWPQTLTNHNIQEIVINGPVNRQLSSYPRNYDNHTSLARTGSADWRHLSQNLTRHEVSVDHIESFGNWIELKRRLQSSKTVDCLTETQLLNEIDRWDNVLKRIISIIIMMASQNIAFRGSSDKLYDENNGNFLKIVELMAEFDPIMEYHVSKAGENPNKTHYLSKNIRKEIVQLVARATREEILKIIRKAKYYSIIADCTPDASHQEQLTLIIQYLLITKHNDSVDVGIRESFFIIIDDTTGHGLERKIVASLNENKLPLEDMRGQAYDNGANMRGKNMGLQKKILDRNKRALFVSCTAHSLNLVVVDSVKVGLEIVIFFRIIKSLYNFFSGSTKRWSILESKCPSLTESLSDTRWESHIRAVKAIKENMQKIYERLPEVAKSDCDGTTKLSAESIAAKMDTLELICEIVIWHDVLNEINCTNKIRGKAPMMAYLTLKLHYSVS
ncbi:zinc finger MYM-type protein 1-like [Hydra vulgaris]|uniref:Zinc finger MYM-type protein 1-like n=1 Tax=Hydra vulgaris TaxID=6087 RepID=A0ABM4CRT9_HYDVU